MSPPLPPPDAAPVGLVGALYTGTARGLASDLAAARALGLDAHPVCTALVAASHGRVSDVVEVPEDTVRAQLEHLRATVRPAGFTLGALATPRTAVAVFRALEDVAGPVVLDLVASGPSGETLLDRRGLEAVGGLMHRADLVTLSRRDAELAANAEITSLDDAQVAAQRLHRRGARRVLVRCGRLPARFFDAADDPGGDGAAHTFEADLYYDGEDFALFEAPHVEGGEVEGAASAYAVAILAGLLRGEPMVPAIQAAKRYVTEAIRHGRARRERRLLDLDWPRTTAPS